MVLIQDAKLVFQYAWSIRVALLIAALNGLYGAFDVLKDLIPAWLFITLNILLSMACIGVRVLDQTKTKGDTNEPD